MTNRLEVKLPTKRKVVQLDDGIKNIAKASINVVGIGNFGHTIISLINEMNIRGAGIIKVPNNKIESYSKLLISSDLMFVFVNLENERDLLKAKLICEKAKSSGSTVCLCTSRLKKPFYNVLKSIAHTIITINRKAEQTYAIFTKRFVETIEVPSLVGLDYADILAILKAGKIATISKGQSRGKDKVQKATNKLLSKLDKKYMNSAYIIIYAGPEITLDEINEIGEFCTNWAVKDAEVVWGAQVDDEYKNKIELYCLITYNWHKVGRILQND